MQKFIIAIALMVTFPVIASQPTKQSQYVPLSAQEKASHEKNVQAYKLAVSQAREQASQRAKAQERDFEENAAGQTDAQLLAEFNRTILPNIRKMPAHYIKNQQATFMAMMRGYRTAAQAKQQLKGSSASLATAAAPATSLPKGPLTPAPSSANKILVFANGVTNKDPNILIVEPEYSFLWDITAEQIKQYQAWKYNGKVWMPHLPVQQTLNAALSAAAKK